MKLKHSIRIKNKVKTWYCPTLAMGCDGEPDDGSNECPGCGKKLKRRVL